MKSFPASLALFSLFLATKVCTKNMKHELTLTWEVDAPNGQPRPMIKMNGQFPGPTLIWDEGDDIEIWVHNRMPFNSSVHWHGLTMQGTPWSDGAPGLTQKPIEVGETFIYRFQAYPSGTHWYHAHSRLTLLDGLYGAIFIRCTNATYLLVLGKVSDEHRPKDGSPKPWELISDDVRDIPAIDKASKDPKIIIVSDWTNFKSWEYMQAQADADLSIFCVDSILVNGKGSVLCPGEDFLVNHTSNFMKYALYPSRVNDKGPGVFFLSAFSFRVLPTLEVQELSFTPSAEDQTPAVQFRRFANPQMPTEADKVGFRCFAFMISTQGKYLWHGHPETVPLHLQKGCVPSKGSREIVEVDPAEGWVSISFIMAATLKTTVFSIDQHPMWVYEVDGSFIEPQLVDTVHMYAGERYSVLLKLDKKPRDYTIRTPDNGLTQVINAVATLRYKGSTDYSESQGLVNYGGLNSTSVVTLDREHLPPFPPKPPAVRSDAMHVLTTHRWFTPWRYTMSKGPPDTGGMWYEDRGAYTPLLYDTDQELAQNGSLIIRTKNNSWVDLVVQVGSHPRQPQEFPHIMHKHAQKMWKIGGASGIWNYSSVDEALAAQPEAFNLVNPPYRDTFITTFQGSAWIVLRYQVTNPGPWMFHCHIEVHLAGGMAVAILDGVDAWPEIPPEYGPDQKGFRPEDGSPRTIEWERQHGVGGGDDRGRGRGKDFVTCSKGDPPVEGSSPWNDVLRKVIAFLQSLLVDSDNSQKK